MTSPAGRVELSERDPELTSRPGLRVVPPLRRARRALPDWLVGAAVGGGIALGAAISIAGVFGVAAVVALVIVAQVTADQAPRVWRRFRRQ